MGTTHELPALYRDWGLLEFFCPGKPQPQGSKVRNKWRGIRESNEELGPWRERVALVAHEEMVDKAMLVAVPVVLAIEFVMYRPTSTPKRWTPPAIRKPDALKCGRAIEDALTGIVYADDSQVTTHRIRKRLAEVGEPTGARIAVAVDLTCYLDGEKALPSGSGMRRDTG